MASYGGKQDVSGLAPAVSAGPLGRGFLANAALLDASPARLVAVAAIPALAAAWALLSPEQVLSQEMTWDLMFNLAGAWQLHFGHVPHVDFHEPVGQLNFMLTQIGFHVFGFSPRAFLAGAALMAGGLFVAATMAAWRRLPLLPAAIFVVFASLLALMPANVGDAPNAYSFAMSYNRYGWSCIAVLFLILFLPPRPGRAADIADMAVAAVLLTAMFYLKMTYFLVAMVTLPLAACLLQHVRARWPGWCAVGLGAVALAIVPYNYPYWTDLFAAAQAGQLRDTFSFHLNNFLTNAGEYAPYFAAVAVALWMWRRRESSAGLPVAVVFILVAGAALLSQNAQTHVVPAAVVIAFLFYDVVRRHHAPRLPGGAIALLLALLVFPLLAVVTSMASIAGYHAKAMRQTLQTVDHTNLRGLAVPAEAPGLLAAFSVAAGDYRLLNRARAIAPRFELSPSEYVGTLVDAAALLSDVPASRSGVVLLDQVNPLPFMLGLVPPRGGNLWSGPGVPVRPARHVFADADHVLIPKFSTYSPWTKAAATAYGPYLDQHFPVRTESGDWIMLSRRAPRTPVKDRPAVEADLLLPATASTITAP